MAYRVTFRHCLRSCSFYRPLTKTPCLYHASQILRCDYSWSSGNDSSQNSQKSKFFYGAAALSFFGFSSLFYYIVKNNLDLYAYAHQITGSTDDDDNEDEDGDSVPDDDGIAGQFIEGLPTYEASEVAKHTTEETGIWVIYKNGVYDVTEFVDMHPGGDKILLGAGLSIEPFWQLYGVHNQPEVHSLLEKYRIGNLHADDVAAPSESDPYAKDPKRHPALRATSAKPFNAEPPTTLLVDYFYTPNKIFYVRNHLPVPVVKSDEYRLEVEGLGVEKRTFTLADIKKFPKHTITAALQCAGNRRFEMDRVKPVKGLTWNNGAIGNAKWSGARLMDVLEACNFRDNPDIEHVQFEGLDMGPDGKPYGGSVPAEKALDPRRDVILAYEMNGVPLSRDHGYPVRVIVPGIAGARNVKWLAKIILSDKESDSHWQQKDYKGFSPSTDWDTVDFSSAPSIQDLPVTSAICQPHDGEVVKVTDGAIHVKGYAWSGGGNPVVRVDVTIDKGKTWSVAELHQEEDKRSRRWAWTIWEAVIPVDSELKGAEIWVKAVDSSFNTQPENFEYIWNLRGVLSNGYHKIKVQLSH